MKLTIEITKARFYVLVVLALAIGVALIVSGSGFTAGQASHPTLFTDTIRGKTGNVVQIVDSLGIGTASPSQKLDVVGFVNTQGICINGDCRGSFAAINPALTCRVATTTGTSAASIPCAGNEVVTGGGCRPDNLISPVIVSHPAGNGWYCDFQAATGITVFAMCCK